jgi:DNA replication protein DnaC
MKPPQEEQASIDLLISAQVLVIDAFGTGNDTPYARQVFQEILDGRDHQNRGGLVVTCRFSIPALLRRGADDGVVSRLAGMCRAIEMKGADRRVAGRGRLG